MPRKTDSNNPADWLFIAAAELEALRKLAQEELGYAMCRGKLAEVIEKILKAELIRRGWFLEKTHDLRKLGLEIAARDPAFGNEVRVLCEAFNQAYFTTRYPGFDLNEADWPMLCAHLEEVAALHTKVAARLRNDSEDGP